MKRVIVGISGASGIVFGVRALELLQKVDGVETHVVVSPSALRTARDELGLCRDEIYKLGNYAHAYGDIGAPLASGSFRTAGMLVAPCSVKTLSGIAHCYDDNLIVRAADVCLKERLPVVLMFRETPLHAGHIALMAQATANGAIIMPPVPAFYNHPSSLDDIVNHTVGRSLDLLGFDLQVSRWPNVRRSEPMPSCDFWSAAGLSDAEI